MGKIIAIWWGEIKDKETFLIDKEIVNLSWKKNPKILFIPTASSDAEWYCLWFKKYFEENFNVKVDTLCCINKKYTEQELEKKILWSDIIYVWGWNTLKMMKIWRKIWIDKLLKKAYEKGIVLSGLSAGSICWFKYWNSDSWKFTSWSDKLLKVQWLNLIPMLHCPHYETKWHREDSLKIMLKWIPETAIALENFSAIEIVDDKYRILTSRNWAKAYKIYRKNWKHIRQIIEEKKEYQLLNTLFMK